MSPQQIQHLFVFGRNLEDVMTESRSGILLSFQLCTEQRWLSEGSYRPYQSYKGASKDQQGKSNEGFYPQSGLQPTEAHYKEGYSHTWVSDDWSSSQ